MRPTMMPCKSKKKVTYPFDLLGLVLALALALHTRSLDLTNAFSHI